MSKSKSETAVGFLSADKQGDTMSVSGRREQFSSFLQCCLVISTDISTRGTKRHIPREYYVVSCSQFIFPWFLEIRCLWHALIIGSYSHSALDITVFARWFFESKLPICLTEEPYVIVSAGCAVRSLSRAKTCLHLPGKKDDFMQKQCEEVHLIREASDVLKQVYEWDGYSVGSTSPSIKHSLQLKNLSLANFWLYGKQWMMAVVTGFLSWSCLIVLRLNKQAFSFVLVKYILRLLASVKAFGWVDDEMKQKIPELKLCLGKDYIRG